MRNGTVRASISIDLTKHNVPAVSISRDHTIVRIFLVGEDGDYPEGIRVTLTAKQADLLREELWRVTNQPRPLRPTHDESYG